MARFLISNQELNAKIARLLESAAENEEIRIRE